ncbi:MAG: hypothetical protein ABSG67_02555 [Thermoguttaceae bacterium]|jgi:uncharacterized protein YbjQ (UPF0145 family)
MYRPSIRFAVAAAVIIAVAAISCSSGCRSAIATALYLFKGEDVDAEYTGLKGKKVAVVCRPPAGLNYANSGVGKDLVQQMSKLLQERVAKIKVIDAQKVNKWCDENTWEEYGEVGKALKADAVVGVELEKFSIYQAQTLYQGKANAIVRVYDCKDGGKVVFEKILPQTLYPPNTFIQTSDVQESEFRREFVGVLADQIARHFYSHDPYADLGQDNSALRQ